MFVLCVSSLLLFFVIVLLFGFYFSGGFITTFYTASQERLSHCFLAQKSKVKGYTQVILLYSFVQFTKRNVNFGLLSLNARGIRTLEKRKALFQWLSKDKAEVVFLQETYSSPDVENIWKTQWKGDLYFAHVRL